MKTLLITTIVATGALMANADDIATTNAPNFTAVNTKEVTTNTSTLLADSTPTYSSTNYSTTNARSYRSADDQTRSDYREHRHSDGDYRDRDYHGHDYLARSFEAGAIFGEPTGASLKYWFNDTWAIDGVLGWAFHQDDIDFYAHSDVLYHFHDMFHVSRGELLPYIGLGVSAKFRDDHDDIWGIRVPIGVEYLFENCPVSLFGEVAPVLDVSPGARGDFSVGVGVRYRF